MKAITPEQHQEILNNLSLVSDVTGGSGADIQRVGHLREIERYRYAKAMRMASKILLDTQRILEG